MVMAVSCYREIVHNSGKGKKEKLCSAMSILCVPDCHHYMLCSTNYHYSGLATVAYWCTLRCFIKAVKLLMGTFGQRIMCLHNSESGLCV